MNMDWLKCGSYKEAISLRAADRLPKTEEAALEAHLAQCAHCRAELEQLEKLSNELNAWKSAPVEIQPSREAYFRLRQALHDTERAAQPARARSIPRWWQQGEKKTLFGALGAVWALILFFNLDAPTTIAMGERSQPASARVILMALKEASSLGAFEAQEPPRQAKPKDPRQTRGSEEPINRTATHC